MENKNHIIDELIERNACFEQIQSLAKQPFERQREALLDIEDKVKAIVGDDLELVSYHSIRPHNRELRLLMLKRYWLLNWMFKETPETYERMRKVNQHLYDMDRQLHEQMADLCDKLVKEPKPSFVDDYEVKGVLGFEGDDKYSLMPMTIDKEYDSDYPLMITVNESLWGVEKPDKGSPYSGIGLEWSCRYNQTRKEIINDILDDGVSWAHEFHIPFEGLCICHTTMAFVRDLYFPVFDLLHFNSFWSEVHVAYQQFSSRVEW